jgi:hypothetical protein
VAAVENLKTMTAIEIAGNQIGLVRCLTLLHKRLIQNYWWIISMNSTRKPATVSENSQPLGPTTNGRIAF